MTWLDIANRTFLFLMKFLILIAFLKFQVFYLINYRTTWIPKCLLSQFKKASEHYICQNVLWCCMRRKTFVVINVLVFSGLHLCFQSVFWLNGFISVKTRLTSSTWMEDFSSETSVVCWTNYLVFKALSNEHKILCSISV